MNNRPDMRSVLTATCTVLVTALLLFGDGLDAAALTVELLKPGYSDDDVRKVLGLNVLRVMPQAEPVGADLKRRRGASTATLKGMGEATFAVGHLVVRRRTV